MEVDTTLTPQKMIEPLHSNPPFCARNKTPSIGVPAKREIATIENAMPIRTLK